MADEEELCFACACVIPVYMVNATMKHKHKLVLILCLCCCIPLLNWDIAVTNAYACIALVYTWVSCAYACTNAYASVIHVNQALM